MNFDTSFALVLVMLAVCGFGYLAVDKWADSQKTPQALCVERAKTQADRIECMKTTLAK